MKTLTYAIGLLVLLSACSISRGYQEKISLPEGTSVETAKEIVMRIWNDNFMQKVSTKFPNFDPVKYPNRHGMSLQWGVFVSVKGKKSVIILLKIKSKDELGNAKEIIQYGKSIVEQGVRDYFRNRP